jgi:hypothetical protein
MIDCKSDERRSGVQRERFFGAGPALNTSAELVGLPWRYPMKRFASTLVLACACSRDVSVIDDVGDDGGSDAASTGGDGSSSAGSPDATTTTTADPTDPGDDAPKFDVHGGPDTGGSTDDGGQPDIPECDELDEVGPTSLGCEFWAIDLDMAGVMVAAPGLGVGLGNPANEAVDVVIEDMRGPGGTLREIGTAHIEAAQSVVVSINGIGGLLPNEEHYISTHVNDRAAFRITSDSPIVAMQINPVGGAEGVVPEASLLLPTTTLVGSHYAIGYDAESPSGDFVAVVATQDGTTVSTIDGDEMIDAFDVLAFPTESLGFIATGFFVGADAPVAVFSGNWCTYVGGVGWCDHIEEQVMPLSAWGTHYVGAMHPQRTEVGEAHEPVMWRLVAGVDNTTISLTPPVFGDEVVIANAGEFVQFSANEHFIAESEDQPFLLVQYMTGGEGVQWCNLPGTPAGDPWMMQMVPTQQWLRNLPFSTDNSHVRDFVFVARTAGTDVSVACYGKIPDERFEPVGASGFEVGWIDLDNVGGGEGDCVDGQHFLLADEPVGAYVGGVDCAASYGYPGGMSLTGLWDPPTLPEG